MTRYEPHCDCLGGHVDMRPDPNGRWCRADEGWQDISTAPPGCVTEDAGCRGSSEWFLGRVASKYRLGRPPYIVIRRCAWPHEDSWECAGEARYVPAFFDGWVPVPAKPTRTEADLRAEVERQAYERGWRAAIEAAASHCWSKRDLLADAEKKQVAAGLTGRDYYGRRLEAELLSRTIRALSPETDGGLT